MDGRLDPDDLDPSDLERFRRGDPRGLEAVYRVHGARVQRTCLALLGNRSDAEDAAQEVFLRAFEHAGQFEGGSKLSTWLHRIAVNHCLHKKEKEGLRRAEPIEEALRSSLASERDAPHEVAGARDAREVLLERLGRLSEEHRTILVLREIDGLAYEEIAGVLGVPPGTVMSRLARARERWLELVPRDPSGARAAAGAARRNGR